MSDVNKEVQQFQMDLFLQNLVKLIPIEIIALFAIIKGLIPTTASTISVWVVLGVLVVLTPLYIVFAMKVNKVSQVILMTIALPIWILAIGGLPIDALIEPWILSVALALFTLIPPMFYGQRIKVQNEPVNEFATNSSRKKIKSWREV